MITGIGDASILPFPAVRWGFSHQDLRVNVHTASTTLLRAQLYNTSTDEQSGKVYIQWPNEGTRRIRCNVNPLNIRAIESMSSP